MKQSDRCTINPCDHVACTGHTANGRRIVPAILSQRCAATVLYDDERCAMTRENKSSYCAHHEMPAERALQPWTNQQERLLFIARELIQSRSDDHWRGQRWARVDPELMAELTAIVQQISDDAVAVIKADRQEYEAFKLMEERGSHFEAALAALYFKSDSGNQARIREAFRETINQNIDNLRYIAPEVRRGF